ncbi:LCP family protein [Streptococcus entericus]|uniref:LCP family protein n=1 Tax=Streptococcus entericus TaxID=155680 RepID=UPI00035FB1FF|nr:LCP family protein [Streptococcus entericus]
MKKSTFLSRHEQLRYDYLTQNIHFLGEKEKAELAYLSAKAEGNEPRVVSYAQEENHLTDRQSELSSLRNLELTDERPRRSKKSVNKQVSAPKKLAKKTSFGLKVKRFVKVTVALMLLLVIGMAVMFFKGLFGVTSGQENLKPAMTEYFAGEKTADGVNILILGSDKRITEESTEARTDTIMVMNVGNSSGKVKLVSFLRDTLVNIEGASYEGMADHKLNAAFTIGEQDNSQGAEYVRQVLKNNFDITIEYYVMIDFETFALAVDTLFPNGVEMDAKFSTVNGEVVGAVDVPDDLGFASGGSLYQTIQVGPQRMDGKTLLNYARFRSDDEGDNGRTRRQQEVMQAVLSQIKDPTKLFTGSEALGKIYALTSTNISFPFILSNGLSGLTASQKGIERMSIPEQGDWIDEYDLYGGLGLLIDFEAYKQRLAELGLR